MRDDALGEYLSKSRASNASGVGGGVPVILDVVVIRPFISHLYKSGMGHAECSLDQARSHQAQSAVECSADSVLVIRS